MSKRSLSDNRNTQPGHPGRPYTPSKTEQKIKNEIFIIPTRTSSRMIDIFEFKFKNQLIRIALKF